MFRCSMFFGFLLLLTQCAPSFSEYFDSTTQVNSFHTHVVNDPLQLHFKTGADIRFLTDRKKIVKQLKKHALPLDGLLAYGETQVAPHYQLFLWLNPDKTIQSEDHMETVHDTLLSKQKIILMCRSLKESPSNAYKNDCKSIFDSFIIGEKYREQLVSVFDVSSQFSNSNKYFHALNEIQAYPAKDRNEEWLKLQLALNYASFLAPNTNYNLLLEKFERQSRKDSIEQIIQKEAIHGKQPVYQKILDKTSNARLVMFNENHFFPNHRITVSELLPDLKEQGFNYLALEALGRKQDSLLNAGHPPTLDTGFYTREQHFAELIRTAQKLDFTFVSYENFDQEKDREVGQADNLHRKTFGNDDSARVVVLAGLAHILEQPTPKGKSWLGNLLHKKYGLNPLTISQSHLNHYREMAKPIAMLPGDCLQSHPYNSVDLLLLNNLPLKKTNPNFSFENFYDENVQVAVFRNNKSERAKSYVGNIPYRTGMVGPGEKFSTRLPAGEFHMIVFDKNGDVLIEKQTKPIL